jgi:predicted peptidase
MTREEKIFETLEYLETHDDGFDPSKKHPLIIDIHGAGGRNTNLDVISNRDLYSAIDGRGYGFVTAAPLCRYDSWFDCYEMLNRFIDDLISRDYIDEDRVYLIGASMGGYCVWQLALSHPEKYAAIIPICGGGMYLNARRLLGLPVWAFHGALDTTVFPEESQKMVDAINRRGGNAKLTIYPDVEHAAWTHTFANQDIYKWLLSNSRGKKQTESDDFGDVKKFG